MIEIGENPQHIKGINKFIDSITNEGLRGKIIAIHKSKKHAVILAMNTTCDNRSVIWGKLYLISEKSKDQYPLTQTQITEIPNTEDWEIV